MTTFYTFRKNVKLKAGQIVGFLTGKGYYATTPNAPPLVVLPSPGLLALAQAKKWVGTKENPSGSNSTPFGVWFGMNRVPWCAIFASFCFSFGARVLIAQAGYPGAVVGKGNSYVPSIESWLRHTGQWLGRVTPKPGDLAIYNWDAGEPDHIGIVETVHPDGSFTAIEGNTAVGNDSNGGEVMRRLRYPSQVDGFGRIK